MPIIKNLHEKYELLAQELASKKRLSFAEAAAILGVSLEQFDRRKVYEFMTGRKWVRIDKSQRPGFLVVVEEVAAEAR